MSTSTNYAPAILVGLKPEQVDALLLIQAPVFTPADQSLTNQTVLQNANGLLFAVAAGETWLGEFWLDVGAALATTGARFGVTTPAGAAQNINVSVFPNSLTGGNGMAQRTVTSGQSLTFTAGTQVGVTDAQVKVSVWVANGSTPGFVQAQFAQQTSSGTAITLRAGSYGTARRIA